MGLRLFTDHCISNFIIQELLKADYEVLKLKDYIPVESSDPTVISTAQDLDSILVSLNGDFADALNYPPSKYKGIITLQVRNHPEVIPQLMMRLINYLTLHPDLESYQGKLILVEAHRIRIRQ
jgi:predicted nuclease of predicted toxin-antitoxin system